MTADLVELFPKLAEQLAPRPGYAEHPIGRRQGPSRRRRSAPSLRGEVARLIELVARVEPLVEAISAELVVTARERRRMSETLDAVARQIVELRRDHGLTALHVAPHHTRRRPLVPYERTRCRL
jgi:hypothetical protein